jgi:hypothetical protein
LCGLPVVCLFVSNLCFFKNISVCITKDTITVALHLLDANRDAGLHAGIGSRPAGGNRNSVSFSSATNSSAPVPAAAAASTANAVNGMQLEDISEHDHDLSLPPASSSTAAASGLLGKVHEGDTEDDTTPPGTNASLSLNGGDFTADGTAGGAASGGGAVADDIVPAAPSVLMTPGTAARTSAHAPVRTSIAATASGGSNSSSSSSSGGGTGGGSSKVSQNGADTGAGSGGVGGGGVSSLLSGSTSPGTGLGASTTGVGGGGYIMGVADAGMHSIISDMVQAIETAVWDAALER